MGTLSGMAEEKKIKIKFSFEKATRAGEKMKTERWTLKMRTAENR